MRLLPGDTFRVIFRVGAAETLAGVFVVAGAPGRPERWTVRSNGTSPSVVLLTADERLALDAAMAEYLDGVEELVCMTVPAATTLVERARGGGSAEDDEP